MDSGIYLLLFVLALIVAKVSFMLKSKKLQSVGKWIYLLAVFVMFLAVGWSLTHFGQG